MLAAVIALCAALGVGWALVHCLIETGVDGYSGIERKYAAIG